MSVRKLKRLNVSDEGPETGEDSEDDLVRSYLPADRYLLLRQVVSEAI